MTSDNDRAIFEKVEKTIQKLVASSSNEEAKQTYADWQSYDEDLDAYGYVAPKIAADLLCQMLSDTNACLYDAGCGSGKVGTQLAAAGYRNLTGADLSESMLQRAQLTGAYQELKIADFSEPLTEPDNHYDGLISVGVWNNSLGEFLTTEMLRIIKPEAPVVFSVRPQFMPALETQLKELESQQAISSVTMERSDYITGQKSEAFYIALRKNQKKLDVT